MQLLRTLTPLAGLLVFAQAQTTDTCAEGVHIIVAPGEGQTPPNLSLIGSLVSDIESAIDNSDHYQVPYPIPQNSTDGKRITEVGAQMARQAIKDYHVSCPDTPIVMAGYSAGAIIVMNAICGQAPPYPTMHPMKKKFANQIIATVTYGDQTFVPNEPYDQGTCVSGTGAKLPRSQDNIDACKNFTPNVQEFCDFGDGQCCQGGTDPNAHFEYQKYDQQATDYVVSKYTGPLNQAAKKQSAKKHGSKKRSN